MAPKLVSHQEDNNAEGSSSYSSTHYVSQSAYIKATQSLLNKRQSDLYADVFGGVEDDDQDINGIREEDKNATNKLINKLDKHTVEIEMLERRQKQLGEAAKIGRDIRNKLDTIGFRGNVIKSTISGIMDTAALMKDVGVVEFWSADVPGSSSGSSQAILHKDFALSTSIFQNALAPFKNSPFPFRLAATMAVGQGLKEGHDRWQPEYFTGLKHRRQDIALLAEKFRRDSAEAADARAGNAVGQVLVQEYGQDGRLFLEKVMNEVDRSAYHYMLALQHRPPRFMQADEQLAESGATSESLQLLFARLEEANFINTFGKDKQPVVEEWTPNAAAFPGADRLLVAKKPITNDAQSSSRARHDESAKVDFDSIKRWDYSSSLSVVLNDLERKAINSLSSRTDLKQALDASRTGHIDSLLTLAKICENGAHGILKDAEPRLFAKQLYTHAANKGNAEAQYRLGLLHADKRFTRLKELRNDNVALQWLTEAAAQNHPEAQAELGLMYANGRSKLDAHEATMHARMWCEDAVSAGVRRADVFFTLGGLYQKDSIDDPSNEISASMMRQCYAAAAEKGHVGAQRELGLVHLKDKKYTDAVKYLEMAARQNDLESFYYLGEIHHDKRADITGFVKEIAGDDLIDAAAYCIELSANGGYAQAQFKLGCMLAKGEINTKDGKPDYEEAARRYEEAGQQKHGAAQYELAQMYEVGSVPPKNGKSSDEAAREEYEKAAKNGIMNALLALAKLYKDGRGGTEPGAPTNKMIAHYLECAASHEGAPSIIAYDLARLYAQRTSGLAKGREGDKLAVKWYTQAAEKGLKDAAYELAHLYMEKGRVDNLTDEKRAALAEKWYIEAADAGHARAQRELGLLHFNRIPGLKGSGKTKEAKGANDVDAAWYLSLAAEQDDLEASSVLGEMYITKRSSVKDLTAEDAAANCFTRAADGGFKEAQYRLGLMLAYGETGTKDGNPDYEKAADRFYQAVGQEHRDAKYQLAILFERGLASSKDGRSPGDAAEDLYQQAASDGNLFAQLKLIELYEDKAKQGIEGNPAIDKEITRYLTLAAGNKEGADIYKCDAQYKLALRHLKSLDTLPTGAGANQKAAKAFELLTLAAKQKHPGACYELGYWHEEPRFGLPKQSNLAKAAELYRVAAEKKVAEAQYRLGQLYRTGTAVPEGVDKWNEMKRLFQQASQQGHMHARFYHGLMLRIRKEGNEDARQGRRLMVEAAGHGDPDLQFKLAEHFLGNDPVATRKLTQDGIEWLEEAADQGHKQALKRLGELCIDGLLSREQNERAWGYFEKAAVEKKDTDSMRMLGWMSEAGIGLSERNYAQAVAYYKQAVENDDSDGYSRYRLGALTEAGHNGHLVKGEIADQAAFKLYRQAIRKGNAQAKAALDKMRDEGRGLRKVSLADKNKVRVVSRNEEEPMYADEEEPMSTVSERRKPRKQTAAEKGKQKVENVSQKAQTTGGHIEIDSDSDTASESDAQKGLVEPTQKGRIDVEQEVEIKLNFKTGESISQSRRFKNGEFVSQTTLINKKSTRR